MIRILGSSKKSAKEMKELTDADRKTLELLPVNVWVGAYDVSYKIKNPYFRLNRLEERGLVESTTVGTYPDLKKMWINKGGSRCH